MVTYLHKDDKYQITLIKSGWNEMFVTVYRLNPTISQDEMEDRRIQPVWRKSFTSAKVDITGKVEVTLPEQFKKEVQLAVAQARVVLGKLKEAEEMLDGISRDYKSQHIAINSIQPTAEEVPLINAQAMRK